MDGHRDGTAYHPPAGPSDIVPIPCRSSFPNRPSTSPAARIARSVSVPSPLLSELVRHAGGDRVFLVTDKGIRAAGVIDPILAVGRRWSRHDRVRRRSRQPDLRQRGEVMVVIESAMG